MNDGIGKYNPSNIKETSTHFTHDNNKLQENNEAYGENEGLDSNLNVTSVLDISFCLLNDAMNTSHINTSTISNSSNTGSLQEGESILEKNGVSNHDLSNSILENMEMADLVQMCKEYRNRVINQPTEENITILQDINTILDKKMKCTNQVPSTIQEHKENQNKIQVSSTAQESKSQTLTQPNPLPIDKVEYSQDVSEETVDFKVLLSSIQKDNSDQQSNLFSDTDDDDTINIAPIQIVKDKNDLVIEEGESKSFQNEIFKSLEFKPMKIRRKQSFDTPDYSKRQHVNSE